MSTIAISTAPNLRRPTRPGGRLTRRGRAVVLLALTLLAFVLVSVGQVIADATSDASAAPVTRTWVVQPGETLWTVAVAIRPDTDPRETVARLVELNGLDASSVTVGQTLRVPS